MGRGSGDLATIIVACMLALGVVGSFANARAKGLTVLHAFAGPPGDGAQSDGSGGTAAFADNGLIEDNGGNFYGVTTFGGSAKRGCNCGVVFAIAANENETVLHAFEGGSDGADPSGALAEDQAGNLYGTTDGGGGSGCSNAEVTGCGTIYRISPNGSESIVYSFGDGSMGARPHSQPIIDATGAVFGTTIFGGNQRCSNDYGNGCGTVFQLTAGGTLDVLHNFKGGDDGYWPNAGVVSDAAGNLYGTTSAGGKDDLGTVFSLLPNGGKKNLHSFTGFPDGAEPGPLYMDASGTLYGTTAGGGMGCAYSQIGCGTVYEILSDGRERVIYTFTGGQDGGIPEGGLVADQAGNLYGMTSSGGSGCAYGCGVVYKITPREKESVLHHFREIDLGVFPVGNLVLGSGGAMYGITNMGGDENCTDAPRRVRCGVVFKLQP